MSGALCFTVLGLSEGIWGRCEEWLNACRFVEFRKYKSLQIQSRFSLQSTMFGYVSARIPRPCSNALVEGSFGLMADFLSGQSKYSMYLSQKMYWEEEGRFPSASSFSSILGGKIKLSTSTNGGRYSGFSFF